MTKPVLMVGLGEILWDLLPTGKVLGGAPTNFAYMASILGDTGIVASRIGTDDLGREAHQVLYELGLSTSYLQYDDRYETGTAEVSIDTAGQPVFSIKHPVSWDFLEWTSDWEGLAGSAHVICFGSLAQRSPVSASTIDRFLQSAADNVVRICDVNLRQSFYDKVILQRSLRYADILKVNAEELLRVSALLEMTGDEGELAIQLLKEFQLDLVCITRGAHGSLLVSKDKIVQHNGYTVKVMDTVGAGDAFTACLAHLYIRGKSLEDISDSANLFAAWVATQVGGTPRVDRQYMQRVVGQARAKVIEFPIRKQNNADC